MQRVDGIREGVCTHASSQHRHNNRQCREVNSGFFYKTATEREEMVKAERKFIDDRVDKVIALKKKVVGGKVTRLHTCAAF